MIEIKNWNVYDLQQSIHACRYAMKTELETMPTDDFGFETAGVDDIKRAIALASTNANSGHCNFLKGIRVSFDIKYPNYISPELQRYNFVDIVTSSSKMHKLSEIITADSFNKYVDKDTIEKMKKLNDEYKANPSYENMMRLLSNCPQGIELFMRISTNYLQLRTIYAQRKNHKLKEDWGVVCGFIEKLPYFDEFINPKQ